MVDIERACQLRDVRLVEQEDRHRNRGGTGLLLSADGTGEKQRSDACNAEDRSHLFLPCGTALSEQWETADRLADEVVERVRRRGHDRGRPGVAEVTLDTDLLPE